MLRGDNPLVYNLSVIYTNESKRVAQNLKRCEGQKSRPKDSRKNKKMP